jgi:hypothetical protein
MTDMPEYKVLSRENQQEMVKASLLKLEQLHFETMMNITLNGREMQMTFEDGGTQTLGERQGMLDEKLARFRNKYQDLL